MRIEIRRVSNVEHYVTPTCTYILATASHICKHADDCSVSPHIVWINASVITVSHIRHNFRDFSHVQHKLETCCIYPLWFSCCVCPLFRMMIPSYIHWIVVVFRTTDMCLMGVLNLRSDLDVHAKVSAMRSILLPRLYTQPDREDGPIV